MENSQLDLEKAWEPEIKLPTSIGSYKKQENSRKTSASLTMLKPLTVWITTNWKILKEMGIPGHLTCLLRNLYAGQEATVRTRHVTTDWFKIGKRVCQGCVLIITLLSYLICRVHLEKCWTGWSTSWNQDCQEKYQSPQILRWHHPYGRKQRGAKKPLDESEREE